MLKLVLARGLGAESLATNSQTNSDFDSCSAVDKVEQAHIQI